MIWLMALKDIKRMLRDRKALAITLLMPAILTTILGFALGPIFNNDFQLDRAEVAIVSNASVIDDQEQFKTMLFENSLIDSEEASDDFLAELTEFNVEEIFIEEVLESDSIKSFINYEVMSEEEAIRLLEDGTLTAIITIPENINLHMWLNLFTPFRKNVVIDVQTSPNHEIKAGIVETITTSFTDHLSVGVTGKTVLLESAAEFNSADEVQLILGDFMDRLLSSEAELNTIELTHVEGKKQISGFQYYAVGMGVMFMLYGASYGASYSVNERFLKTFERLKMAGASMYSILGGRFLSSFLFTLIQLGFLIGFSMLLFQASWGNFLYVLIVTVSIAVMIGSFTVLLSTFNLIINNQRFSSIFESAFLPIMALLGGSFIPNTQLPRILQVIGDNTLNGAALTSYIKLMQGYSLVNIQGHIFVLFIYSGIFLLIAYFVLKRKGVTQ